MTIMYLGRELNGHKCQSFIRPSLYFSSIEKSISHPFLEPPSPIKQ